MRVSPLRSLHAQAGATLSPYGPESGRAPGVWVVDTFDSLGAEYAALRKACSLLDAPHRGVIEVRGSDRLDFLNRMLTQDLKAPSPGTIRRSFWLNKKGRVDADLRVVNLADRTLLELDVLCAPGTASGLGAYIISEDVTLSDLSEATHRLSLHGPTAAVLLGALDAPPLPGDGAATEWVSEGSTIVAFRDDACAETGVELIVPADKAAAFYQHLIALGHDASHRPGENTPAQKIRLSPIGWHAFNIARIEAGTPLYNLDFGPESLPAETGVLASRVSFTKGCYLGQEIVARMHARGQCKQTVVAVRFEPVVDDTGLPLLPGAGTTLTPPEKQEPVGVVTSSTLSPMLSQTPIALASIRASHSTPGTVLDASFEGRMLRGEVQPELRSWPRPARGA